MGIWTRTTYRMKNYKSAASVHICPPYATLLRSFLLPTTLPVSCVHGWLCLPPHPPFRPDHQTHPLKNCCRRDSTCYRGEIASSRSCREIKMSRASRCGTVERQQRRAIWISHARTMWRPRSIWHRGCLFLRILYRLNSSGKNFCDTRKYSMWSRIQWARWVVYVNPLRGSFINLR